MIPPRADTGDPPALHLQSFDVVQRWVEHTHRGCEPCFDCLALLHQAVKEAMAAQRSEATARPHWQPIESAPKDRVIIGALIHSGRIWRVHDMKHNGLAFYTVNGGSLPKMTHWTDMLPLPDPPQ